MKLFGIKDTRTNKFVPDMWGQRRDQLKEYRDELNKAEGEVVYTISFGPDHHEFKGKQ
jgi:hypothetical protein